MPLPRWGDQVKIVEGHLCGLGDEVMEYQGETHLMLCIPVIRQVLRINPSVAWIQPEDPRRRAA